MKNMVNELKRALVLYRQNRPDEALEIYRGILKQDPQNADAWSGLAAVMRNLGDMRGAAAAYEKAAALRPKSFAFQFNAGLASYVHKDFAKAYAFFSRALALKGDSAEANRLAGVCRSELGDIDGAEALLRTACACDPANAAAAYDLANILCDAGKAGDAEQWYRRALEIRPDFTEAAANLGELLQAVGRTAEAMSLYESILLRCPATPIVVSNALLCLNYNPPADKNAVYETHCRLASACYAGEAATAPAVRRGPARRPLRIGYVSADFRRHSVASFLLPVVANHDHGAYEVYCYAHVEKPDRRSEEFKKHAVWRDIFGLDDEAALRLIRDDDIDILVDLGGHTAGNRLGIFGRRAAPVQVTYCGYPNTTGLRAIDYRLTDWIADPDGEERYYAEKLMRLPGCFLCYAPPQGAPLPDAGAAAGRRAPVFGSFNNIAKISDATMDAWCAILRRVPAARLLLKYRYLDDSTVQQRLAQRFHDRGIGRERIDFQGRIRSLKEHLAVYNLVDIALDTFPYNGATTTCEALWMGVPVVTVAGDRHAARVGASLLSAAGVSELVTHDVEGYVETAVALAADRSRIVSFRQTLRGRVAQGMLCDGTSFTRGLEEAYQTMMEGRNG